MTGIRSLLALLLAGITLPLAGRSQEVTGPDGHVRRPAQGILDYSVEVDLTTDDPRVTTTVTFAATAPLAKLELDYRGPDVVEVSLPQAGDAKAVSPAFEWENGLLEIPLPLPLAVGETARVEIQTRGLPERGLFRAKNRHGDLVVFTDAWPSDTRYWMPCEDHPDDKATFSARFHLRKGWRAVSNGLQESDRAEPDGTTIVQWKSAQPLYTAVMSFAAGPFTVVESKWHEVPLQWWLYPQDVAAGTKDFAVHAQALDWLEAAIGPYPYAKYAVVQIPTQYGGMENASNTFLREAAVDGTGSSAPVLIHEAVHQWFGDSVTESDWHDLWLSEGFADYFCALAMEGLGMQPLAQTMAEERRVVLANRRVRTRPICGTTPIDPKEHLDANSYQKGAWVLHLLRQEVGERAFFAGIRSYYASHRDGNATRSDLRDALEKASGKDLAASFHQWLERPGFPRLHATVTRDGADLLLEWRQENVTKEDPGPFDFTVEFAARPAVDGSKAPAAADAPAPVMVRFQGDHGSARLQGLGQAAVLIVDPDVKSLFEPDFTGIEIAGAR